MCTASIVRVFTRIARPASRADFLLQMSCLGRLDTNYRDVASPIFPERLYSQGLFPSVRLAR